MICPTWCSLRMYDIQDYTHRMFLVPELGVVLAHRAHMLQECWAVLCTKGQQPQLVSYDTTYNLGDCMYHDFYSDIPSCSPVSRVQYRTRLLQEQQLKAPYCVKENGRQQRCYSETHAIDSFNIWGSPPVSVLRH